MLAPPNRRPSISFTAIALALGAMGCSSSGDESAAAFGSPSDHVDPRDDAAQVVDDSPLEGRPPALGGRVDAVVELPRAVVAQAPSGPMAAPQAAPFASLSVEALAVDMIHPVAATLPDGSVRIAAVDASRTIPQIQDSTGAFIDLPSVVPDPQTRTIAVTTSSDGTVHLVWDAGGRAFYVQLYDDDTFSSPTPVATVPARDPVLAISPAGNVVVAFTSDPPDDAPYGLMSDVKVVMGAFEGDLLQFGAPIILNPYLADEYLDFTSGPSLAIAPDGSMHVVFEFTTSGLTVIDYVSVSVDGAVSEPRTITTASQFPCPAIYADDDGAHITYIPMIGDSVRYAHVRDGETISDEPVYEPDPYASFTLALMTRDASGATHLGMTHYQDGTYKLEYGLLSGGTFDRVDVATSDVTGFEMTPTTGGFLLAGDGGVIVPFVHDGDVSVATSEGG